jgi:cysteinyl-tRNA synthetase
LIAQRVAARAQKNWTRADEIRDELSALGIQIQDGPNGTEWRT